MTRKDYVLIADALKHAAACDPGTEGGGIYRAAVCIADALAADNPRFDRARFLQACGVAS